MIQIRQSIFETNSSSTHALVIMKTSDFLKWKNSSDEDDENKLYWNYQNAWRNDKYTSAEQRFLTQAEIIELMKQDDYYKDYINDPEQISEFAEQESYWLYSDIEDRYDMDSVTEGDITAFSYSGYDN